MLDLAGTAGADPPRAACRRSTRGWPPAGRRRRRHAAAEAAPRRAAAADRHRRPRARRRRQPRPPRAAAARRPRPRPRARRPARDRRDRRRALVPDLGRRRPARPLRALGRRGRRGRRAPTSRPGSACSTPASSPATPTWPPGSRTATLASWRQAASQLLPQLRDLRRDRARQLGELAFLLEPDLKEAYGGLREGQVLRAVAAAQLGDEPGRRARGGLRPPARRPRRAAPARPAAPTDVLVRQEQRPVADALGLPDEDALLREVSLAGRRLGLRRRRDLAPGGGRAGPPPARPLPAACAASRSPRASSARATRSCSRGTHARPPTPGCCCARRPPRRGRTCLLSPYTLKVLAVHSPPLPEPWPAEVRWSLPPRCWPAAGPPSPLLEQLDQEGLLVAADPRVGPRALAAAAPPVAPVHRRPAPGRGGGRGGGADPRRRPPRPAAGRRAAARHRQGLAGRPQRGRRADRRRDRRADGLLGAGRRDARPCSCGTTCCCRRPPPAATSTTPPPSTGSRRRSAATPRVLQLLHALAQADGAATSASAWSPWKAHLVAALVARVQAKLGGAPMPEPEPVLHPTEPQVDRPAARRPRRRRCGDRRRSRTSPTASRSPIGAPDRPGLLSTCAGVLAAQPARRRAPRRCRSTAGYGDRRCSRCARASGGPRCRRSWPTPCGPRWRARSRWPTGCASARPTTGRTAPGPRRRGSRGTTARSAARRRASSRCAPATGPGCCYRLTAAIAGEGLDVTSAPGSRRSAPTRSTASTCATPPGRRSSRAARGGSTRRWSAATRGRAGERLRGRHAGLGPRFCQ